MHAHSNFDWKTHFSTPRKPKAVKHSVSFGGDFGLDFKASDIPFGAELSQAFGGDFNAGADGLKVHTQTQFGASPGDVVAYRNLWTPYVRAVVEAARAYPDAQASTKEFAELIAKHWNAYAGTTPAELLVISDEALKWFQDVVKSALILGKWPWMVEYDIPPIPSEGDQSKVINALENASLVTRGALGILSAGMSLEGLQAGLGVLGQSAGKVVGALGGGVIQGAGSGALAAVKSSGIPVWAWIAAGGVAAAVLPVFIAQNPIFRVLARR